MNKTPMEWVKNPDGTPGYTWNPITGCLNGCEYCYARKLANGRLKSRYLANLNIAKEPQIVPKPSDPFYPRFWEDRLEDLTPTIFSKKPRGIFVCDMSDLFGIGIPDEWTGRILRAIKLTPQNRYYLLTKQPQNLIKWSPFPPNCWVGVTATGYKMFNEATFNLRGIEAKVKYISFEPLLEPIGNMLAWLGQAVNWVIIGSQTKPTVYPKDKWVQGIEQVADKVGIPVFEKDNLYPAGFRHLLRQELPDR